MNVSMIGKVGGWLQFLLNIVSQVATAGVPTGFAGWAGMLGSLAIAVGTHAASSTDGKK